MVVLIFSFFGFVILKNLFDKIKNISEKMSDSFITLDSKDQLKTGADELQNIIQSFTAIKNQFASTFSGSSSGKFLSSTIMVLSCLKTA